MNIISMKLVTTDRHFHDEFDKHKERFLEILENSYSSYHGREYQLKRLFDGESTLYLAFDDELLVGVSYIKQNLRRGGTAVFPEKYRRAGIAEALTKASLVDFPKQYTILLASNYKMVALMQKLGFRRAGSAEEVKTVIKDDFSNLSNFRLTDSGLIFNRKSTRRDAERDNLTLLHTF